MAKLSRNFYDRQVPSRNLVTTIAGIITLVLTILVGFGVITPEQQGELQTHATTVVNAVVAVWGAITSIILMFKSVDG
jgi:uncharacterized membrane protein